MTDFYDLDLDAIENDDADSERPMKLDEGETVLRILPPWRKGALYYKKYKMHFGLPELRNFGLQVDNWAAEPCLSSRSVVVDDTVIEEENQPCPLCALANKAWTVGNREHNEELLSLSKKIRAKRQYISNVVDLGDNELRVQKYAYGQKIHESLKLIFRKKKNITHPETGRAICISKKQGPQWPEYQVQAEDAEDFTDKWEQVKNSLVNLDNYPKYSSAKEIEERLTGVSFSHAVEFTRTQEPEEDDLPSDTGSESLDELLSS